MPTCRWRTAGSHKIRLSLTQRAGWPQRPLRLGSPWRGLLSRPGRPSVRRPVCVLTRDAAIAVLNTVTSAPITRTIRSIRSEVEVGSEQGLPEPSVITCDDLLTVLQTVLDREAAGQLDQVKRAEVDRALRDALEIQS